ncbi:protein kinase [Streptomyces sp. CBMA152]|uniref:protein kinase n=1 Tax=Streptomyces sp. CBMA152 TaxID=1896312 RepID=UPI00166080CB|nr:protein kinase [Streptomyces sp. CBMA152]MBD0745525.1 hypothetical protein [Streptomyces sp. CBMA152]
MDEYAGRVLADRYRLPLPPSDEYELVETRAFDTYSGQEVLVRRVPLPEVVDAEVQGADGRYGGGFGGGAQRRPADPFLRRAIEAAQAAARIPDHPRLDQVFDVFAEDGSLWIVSELVMARPLAALLAERPMAPYRAAEVASDVLTALRVLHAHGWTHRNITARTVLICDDGRVMLTGLAVGAAEEALCGYAVVPAGFDGGDDDFGAPGAGEPVEATDGADVVDPHAPFRPPAPTAPAARPASLPSTRAPALPAGWSPAGPDGDGPDDDVEAANGQAGPGQGGALVPRPGTSTAAGTRAGAIAAYRAGARAAARVGDDGALPMQRPAPPQAELEGVWRDADTGSRADVVDRDMYDPVSGTRVPRTPAAGSHATPATSHTTGHTTASASPYAVEEGPDSGRTRRAYDPVTGRWIPRPELARPPGAPTSSGAPGVPSAPPATTGPPPSAAPQPALPHAVGAGADALRADAQRQTHASAGVVARENGAGGWGAVAPQPHGGGYHGPTTRLAAERARQTRIAVVGGVTERWAPEQAGPIHENWRLAPPIGPATDLWALGALLFRAVQGHAPYPEENAVELVQMVCGEPPAFAEECGPLRPVVESLLRQDPTERPDFEELRGWLRSIVRSAPEPDAGTHVVPLPSPDATRLPILRRRGELVRRRRAASGEHGRHRQKRQPKPRRPERLSRHEEFSEPGVSLRAESRTSRTPKRERTRAPERENTPRSLGRSLVLLVLLLLVAALAYAVFFMPRSGSKDATDNGGGSPAGKSAPRTTPTPGTGTTERTGSPSSPQTQTTAPGGQPPAKGYVIRTDPEGFRTAVDPSFERQPINDAGQVRYVGGDFTLVVVPGRDSVKSMGDDPLAYQRDKERELQPFRDSAWATAAGLRRVDIGRKVTAEGQFTWRDSTGRTVYVRNQVMILNGRYHLIQVIGPEPQRDKVTEIYTQATAAYSATR